MLPNDFYARIGSLTLLSLGSIYVEGDSFHNKDIIYPIGYTIQRVYWSGKNVIKFFFFFFFLFKKKTLPIKISFFLFFKK